MYTLIKPRFFNLYADSASLIFSSIMSYIAYKDCDSQLNTATAAINTVLETPKEVSSLKYAIQTIP